MKALLIAEDNIANQMVIKALMKKLAVDFEIYENGRQIIDRLKSHDCRYDLLLLDCEMPVLDGFQTAKEVRLWEKERNTRPVFICSFTAHVDDAVIQRCYDSGMDTYMAKPVDIKHLSAILKQALETTA